ncbi:hypothetical protein [Streptomyces sp. SBT349]|uniref:hypothetical protein n=1 Tax=Streptomyces sp. SBT349 TaxID=1580539 RepID=UPI00066D7CDB|nr:hypothetical protein [Streptomyces sp. SBT349]
MTASPPSWHLGIDIGGTKVALRAESAVGRTEEHTFSWPHHEDGPDEQVTSWPSRPSWTGLALGPALRALVPGAAVAWADDGDVAALAEAAAADCADLLYVGVGTCIGGGLVLGGLSSLQARSSLPEPSPAEPYRLNSAPMDRRGA